MKRRKTFFAAAVLAVLSMILNITSVFATISTSYQTPPVTPPVGMHPRVLFTEDDIPRLQEALASDDDENAYARARFVYNRDLPEDHPNGNGGGNANGGFSYKKLAHIEAKAFDYAVNGNATNGGLARDYMIQYLDTMGTSYSDQTDYSRYIGLAIYTASKVYDWCYDLFTPAQRTAMIAKIESLAQGMEVGYPPTNLSAISGHAAEAQLLRDLLSFAIAVYDERPDIWNAVAGRFYQEYVPARDYFNTANFKLEGDSYGMYRHRWDVYAYLLITGMGEESPYENPDDLYQTAYSMLYMRRPDGQYMRDGDTANDTAASPFSLWTNHTEIFMVDAAIGDDPYLKYEWIKNDPSLEGAYEDTHLLRLILNNPEVKPKLAYNLPLSRFFKAPANVMIARTGWDDGVNSDTAVAMMKIGGDVINGHQHLDAGNFQLYYKGILASNSGVYQGGSADSTYNSTHHKVYASKTVASNCMLVYDPNEPYTYQEHWWSDVEYPENRDNCLDGGQRTINGANEPAQLSEVETVATVESHEVDQTKPSAPSYTYIKGDLTNAYSDKISDYKRSFMFLNLDREDVPAALIVFDKVTSSNASFKKTWLLHGQQEPTVSGTKTVFKRTYSDGTNSYNGKMTVDTLLPQSPSITKRGGAGNYSYVGGRLNKAYEATESATETDEGNTWRIEVSPSSNNTTDQFLNVLQVSDADKSNYLSVTKIDDSAVVGAVISNRVVTFAKDGRELTSSFSFTAPKGTYEYTLCDAKKGQWQVSTDSSFGTYDTVISNDGGNVLHFTKTLSSGATLYCRYVGGLAGTGLSYTAYEGETTNIDYCTLYKGFADGSGSQRIYTKTMARRDENNKPLVAATDISNILGTSLSKNGNTVTFSKDGKECSLTKGETSITKGGVTVSKPNEAAPVEIDGAYYVSPISVSAYFGAGYSLNERMREMEITPGMVDGDMELQYSLDGINYETISGFNEGVYNYNVELPVHKTNVYLRVVNSLGTQYFSNISGTTGAEAGLSGLGDWSNASEATLEQYALPRYLSDGNSMESASLPIKNDYGTIKMYYTAPEGGEQTYTVTFHSVQPRITYLEANIAINKTTTRAPVYIRGGAAWNDNGTILDSRMGRNEDRVWALGHISPSLQGASMFVLPIDEMANAGTRITGENPGRTYFFKFAADCPGRVVVLMGNEANENSAYRISEGDWHAGSNNGVGINSISVRSHVPTKVTGDPSNDAQYHAVAYKWQSVKYTDEGDKSISGKNGYRTYHPGIIDAPSKNDAAKDGQKLLYSYYRDFNEGDVIEIPNPKNLIADVKSDLIGIFVIYDEDPTPVPCDIEISYSTDGTNYSKIPSFDSTKTSYKVILPDNSKYAYMKVDVPYDTSASVFSKSARNGSSLAGETLTASMNFNGSNSTYQHMMKTPVVNNAIPIKNEQGSAIIEYTKEDGTNVTYTIDFRANQPRLTEFNKYITDGSVAFIGGAAVNNDNGTIIDANNTDVRIPALANVSKKLVGTSMFMLPWQQMVKSDSSWAITNPNAVMFSYKADTAGDVYVMLTDAATTSDYTNNWEAVNNGTAADGVTISQSSSTARTYNDYDNTDYFAGVYKWVCAKNANYEGANLYRVAEPGLTGTLSGTYVKGAAPLKYVYKKHFNAGELVNIYNPGMISTNEITGYIPILIDWDDEEAPDVSYAVDASGELTVNASGFNNTDNVISAIYNSNGSLLDVVKGNYNSNGNSLKFDTASLSDTTKEIGIYIWTSGFEPLFMNKYLLEKVIQ